jgi:D-alanyl-D-alanine carboxypeptidase (penicillin-binding protein 5/6)
MASLNDDQNRRNIFCTTGSLQERGLRHLARRVGGWWLLLPIALWAFAIVVGLELLPKTDMGTAALPTPSMRVIAPRIPTPFALQPKQPTSTPVAVQAPSIMPKVKNEGTPPQRKARTPDPNPSTDHFVVVDGASGAILFQRNAFEPVAPASLTKIMTGLLVVEYGKLDEKVRVDVDAGGYPDSCVMGLRINTEVGLRDLLYGLILASGNDAAVAIARHLTGGVGSAFMNKMNEKAAWLGLGGTHFENPHGFDEENHYSCPADMVTLARYAMQYPEFRKVVATRSYEVQSPTDKSSLENLNGILRAYPGSDGVKTGDTPEAGKCLVATAVRDGHRVYVAFMRSSSGSVPDGTLLLDWAFDSHYWGSTQSSPGQ